MSGRLTLQSVLPDVAEALNLNQYAPVDPTNPTAARKPNRRVVRYINQAQEELLSKGRWVGTLIRYKLCSQGGGIITWPREIGTIEAMDFNGYNVDLRNQWFDFIDFGPREMYSNDWWNLGGSWRSSISVDQPESISFAEVNSCGNPKQLKVYARATEATNSRILLQFYDGQGNYVRTNDATEGWVDGEFVAINAATPATTINTVTSWVGVQKPPTNDVVRITELDTVTGLERLLAIYEHDEVTPSYRRSRIPGARCQLWNLDFQRPCVVTVVGKARFIPAFKPRDYLILQSKAAIVEMARSIYKRENNLPQEAPIYEQKAVQILDEQLLAWIGTAAQTIPQFDMAYGYANGPMNVI